ncbi:MAG: hypothetical protein WD801_10575 [Gemmatimonadaceae bacterium]
MRRILPLVLLLSGGALPAQSFWDSQVRFGPQFVSYDIKAPVNERVSQVAFPMFVSVPVLPALTIDIGTAYASANHERIAVDSTGALVTISSALSGLTDTQLRAIYSLGQDRVVLTAGLNLPTGSATLKPDEFDAATRIGSDFLSFPVSGFGSGFGMTGGVAVAQPMGTWNVGAGASLRSAGEYEPFEDGSGTATSFKPGAEVRARIGADHPWGTGRVSLGLTFSKYGDDRANAAVYNTGDRFIGQVAVSNSLENGVDYSVVLWNLYRAAGTLIDQSVSPSGNITNAMVIFGVSAPANVRVEPSIETRLWSQQGANTSFSATLGTRLVVDRGTWAMVPGFGFTIGTLDAATLTGMRATLTVRVGG